MPPAAGRATAVTCGPPGPGGPRRQRGRRRPPTTPRTWRRTPARVGRTRPRPRVRRGPARRRVGEAMGGRRGRGEDGEQRGGGAAPPGRVRSGSDTTERADMTAEEWVGHHPRAAEVDDRRRVAQPADPNHCGSDQMSRESAGPAPSRLQRSSWRCTVTGPTGMRTPSTSSRRSSSRSHARGWMRMAWFCGPPIPPCEPTWSSNARIRPDASTVEKSTRSPQWGARRAGPGPRRCGSGSRPAGPRLEHPAGQVAHASRPEHQRRPGRAEDHHQADP